MQLRLKEQTQVIKGDVKAGASCTEARAIAPGDHFLRREILHREAKWVKLHGTPIVSAKATNR
jgi:hypothetical protein